MSKMIRVNVRNRIRWDARESKSPAIGYLAYLAFMDKARETRVPALAKKWAECADNCVPAIRPTWRELLSTYRGLYNV